MLLAKKKRKDIHQSIFNMLLPAECVKVKSEGRAEMDGENKRWIWLRKKTTQERDTVAGLVTAV